ncbi:hypothetical protein NQ318_004735 [Aromia moschata]|uniref:Uncharacterized protein n=1 Tax=Aromia moschata TaxID=1265417 RepID=A0AAV8Y1S3_9CUCU|nr:hypothetical protein NQ318_004735 [Aromia moschata]
MFQLHYGSVYGTFMTGHLPILVIKRRTRLRIVEAFKAIRNIPDVFTRIRFNFIRRLRACVEAHGEQFEHLL